MTGPNQCRPRRRRRGVPAQDSCEQSSRSGRKRRLGWLALVADRTPHRHATCRRDDVQTYVLHVSLRQSARAHCARAGVIYDSGGVRRHQAAGSPERRGAASRFGGRPRRGRSADQSIGGSLRIHVRVTSTGMTDPPHVSQWSWCQSRRTTGGSAGRKSVPVQLGQTGDSSTPRSRAHSRQPSSTSNRMLRRLDAFNRGRLVGSSGMPFGSFGADGRGSCSGVNVNPPSLGLFSEARFCRTRGRGGRSRGAAPAERCGPCDSSPGTSSQCTSCVLPSTQPVRQPCTRLDRRSRTRFGKGPPMATGCEPTSGGCGQPFDEPDSKIRQGSELTSLEPS